MDDFREWLSDYLRYFELGGAILLVLLILIFGVRACAKSRGGSEKEEVVQKEETVDATDDAQTSVEDTQEETATAVELEEANADIVDLIQKYFDAIQNGDLAALNTLVDEISPSDEARIANSKDYITSYQVGDVYVKEGLDTNSSVVYACVTYTCKDISTPVPAIFRFYVKKNVDGSYIIDGSAESDAQINTYLSSLQKDAAVQALTEKVQKEYDQALAGDAALAAFLSGLGEESGAAAEEDSAPKNFMVTNDASNVRDAASGDIIDTVDEGTQVEVLDRDGDWYHVRYGGNEGYIYADLLDSVNN